MRESSSGETGYFISPKKANVKKNIPRGNAPGGCGRAYLRMRLPEDDPELRETLPPDEEWEEEPRLPEEEWEPEDGAL
jgi:hypothetical protein